MLEKCSFQQPLLVGKDIKYSYRIPGNLLVKMWLNKLTTSKMQNKVGLDTEILFSIVHIDDWNLVGI